MTSEIFLQRKLIPVTGWKFAFERSKVPFPMLAGSSHQYKSSTTRSET
jgi:hypothetical protein